MHVVGVLLDGTEELPACLSAAERQRRERYARADDRNRFAVGACLVRQAAARWCNIPAIDVRVDRSCPDCGKDHGRPKVAHGPTLSVSHSGRCVVVAAADAVGVGVDIEQVPDDIPSPAVRQLALGPGESVQSAAEFATTWTRKEAALKCTGDGLRVDPTRVLVSNPSDPPRLLRYPNRRDLPDLAQLFDIAEASPAYRGALAVTSTRTITIEETWRDASCGPHTTQCGRHDTTATRDGRSERYRPDRHMIGPAHPNINSGNCTI